MATSDEIRRLQQELSRLRKMMGETSSYKLISKNEVDQVKELNRQIERYQDQLNEIEESWGVVKGIIDDVQNQFGKAQDGFKTALSSFNRLQSISTKFEEDKLGIQRMTAKEIKNNITQIRKEVKVQQEALALLERKKANGEELTDNEKRMVKELKSENIQNEIALRTARERLDEERKINKALGLTGAAIKGITGLLSKVGISTEYFEDIEESMYNAAKSSGRMGAFMAGVEGIGKGLREAFNDPIVPLGLLGKMLTYLYKLNGKLAAKNAVAMKATGGMFGLNELSNMASMSGAMLEDLGKSAEMFRKELGFIPAATEEILQDSFMLEQLGFGGPQIKGMLGVSKDLGVELGDMHKTVAGATGEFEAQTGFTVDTLNAMETLGNASATVRFNMKGSANEMIKAANFATLLGMSMDEIANAAESTLDFESSIQKEMEAELFLNKQLNLDRYRFAALTGDAATQAEELQRLIAENGPALKGNTLAQQKFADALGISREELTASLENMELQQKLGFRSEKSQQRLNQLMAQGKTEQEAINQMKVEGAKGIEAAIQSDLQAQNAMKKLKADLEKTLLPLAKTVAETFQKVAGFVTEEIVPLLNKKIFGNYTVGSLLGAVIGGGLLVKGLMNLFNFKPVMNVGMMRVGAMSGGGMGPGGMGGYGGPGGRNKRGPLTKSGKPDMRYKANRGRRPRVRGRGRGLMGLLGGLGGLFGMNMLMGGGDMGDAAMMTGEDAMFMGGEMAADQVANNLGNKTKPKPKPKPKPKGGGGGFFKSVGNFFSSGVKKVGSALGGAKDFVMGGVSKVGGAVKSGLNFVSDIAGQAKKWLSGKIKGIFPKLLKAIKKPLKGVLTKIPFVGALLEMLFTGMDVNAIAKSKDMTPQEIYSEAGRSIISGGLGLTMGSLAAAAVSSLQAVGIPGWLLSGAAYMGGDFLGRAIGGAISDHVGGPTIGKAVLDLFGADVGSQPTMMATGGIVTGPVNAIVGEAGNEAVVPLTEFYAQFDRLIAAVQAGGDVYLDGAKVGRQLALSTSKIG